MRMGMGMGRTRRPSLPTPCLILVLLIRCLRQSEEQVLLWNIIKLIKVVLVHLRQPIDK